MLQLYTANFICFLIGLQWRSSSFRLHHIFPILMVKMLFFPPNSTGPWPRLHKGKKIPEVDLIPLTCQDEDFGTYCIYIYSVVPRARHCGFPAILPQMSLKNAPRAGLRADSKIWILFRCLLPFPYLV